MKKNKKICFFVALIIALGCFILPQNAGDKAAVAAGDITEITSSDVEYDIYEMSGKDVAAIYAYYGTYTKISIPEKIDGYPVGYLESSSFGDNEYLEYVELPSTVEYIAGGVFDLSTSLTEIAISPNNPYYTCVDGVLYNKDVTTLVSFPGGRAGAFTVPESVVSIGDASFANCKNITEINMYNNVEYIGLSAFEGCSSLSSVRLSDNLRTLSYRAFYNCMSLEEVHLPYSLKSVGKNALAGGIDSEDNLYYHTTNGVYYVAGSYGETYAKGLHLPKGYVLSEPRTLTDIDTNTVLYDPSNAFPEGKKLDLDVKVLSNEENASKIPVRYADMAIYEVAFTVDGVEKSLSKESVVKFESFSENAIPTATKIFVERAGTLVELTRAPQAAFVGTMFTNKEVFYVITNNDFSLKGDVDGDGIHSIYDARFALCLSAGLVSDVTDAQKQTANVDGVGKIDTNDAYEILCYAAGIK